MPAIRHKLVYGSDFPIPPTRLAFHRHLPRRHADIQNMASWLDQDIAIKSAVGIRDDVLTRGGVLLTAQGLAPAIEVMPRR